MAVKVSLVPEVIDYLLGMFRGLTVPDLVDAVGNPLDLLVYDGYPGTDLEDTFVAIGGGYDPTAMGTQEFISLGQPTNAPSRDERVEIRCYATSFVGGADDGGASGQSDAQYLARTNVYRILAAIEAALRTDPQLGGPHATPPTAQPLLTSGWVEFSAGNLTQTNEIDQSVTMGRHATVEFIVAYYQRLYSF